MYNTKGNRYLKLNMLIVDDESEIREILTEVLSELELNFLQAENGLEALDVVKKSKVDLIITDLAMPKMNGFEFLRGLKTAGYQIPCMVLTGHGDKTIAQQVKAFGVVEFIDKPFEMEVLIQKVSSILKNIQTAS